MEMGSFCIVWSRLPPLFFFSPGSAGRALGFWMVALPRPKSCLRSRAQYRERCAALHSPARKINTPGLSPATPALLQRENKTDPPAKQCEFGSEIHFPVRSEPGLYLFFYFFYCPANPLNILRLEAISVPLRVFLRCRAKALSFVLRGALFCFFWVVCGWVFFPFVCLFLYIFFLGAVIPAAIPSSVGRGRARTGTQRVLPGSCLLLFPPRLFGGSHDGFIACLTTS